MKQPAWTKRRLGRTGILVTPLGIGGAWLGCSREKPFDSEVAVETVLRGLELGINLIDTSGLYIGGESERVIGLALEEWVRRGGKREDLVLSTKTGTRVRPYDYSYGHTMQSVETSLRLLKTDWIDVLLVHDPPDLEPVLAPSGALAALQALKAQGTIRAIGLGCRPHDFHQRCIATGEFDVSLCFGDYHLLSQTAVAGVLEPVAVRDTGVLNGMVTMYGLLGDRDPLQVVAERWPGRVPETMAELARRAHELWQWCQARDVSLLALNLQYCQREPRIASTLIGFSRPARVEQDVAACFEPIPDAVWQELCETFHV